MKLVSALVAGAILLAPSISYAAGPVKSKTEIDQVISLIAQHFGEIQSVKIDPPPNAVPVGQRYTVKVVATMPSKLMDALHNQGFDLVALFSGDAKTFDLGEWPHDLPVNVDRDAGLNASNSRVALGEDEEYQIVWSVQGKPAHEGDYSITANFPSAASRPETLRVREDSEAALIDDSVKGAKQAWVPAIVIVSVGMLTVSEPIVLVLSAAGLMVLCMTLPQPWPLVIDILAAIVLLLNAIFRKSLLRQLIDVKHHVGPDQTDPPPIHQPHKHLDGLRTRSESEAAVALYRARMHFALGLLSSAIGLVVLVFPLRRISEDANNGSASAVHLIFAALPYLLVFLGTMLAARFFLGQYRQSLEDRRHYEEALRDREWAQVVAESGVPLADIHPGKAKLS